MLPFDPLLLQNTAAIAGTAPTTFAWDPTTLGGNYTLTNSNLTVTQSGGGSSPAVRGTVAGTGSFIVHVDLTASPIYRIGIGTNSLGSLGQDGNGVGYDFGGAILMNGSTVATGAAYVTGDSIKIAWDGTTATFYKNGALQATYAPGISGVKPAFMASAGASAAATLTDYTHWS